VRRHELELLSVPALKNLPPEPVPLPFMVRVSRAVFSLLSNSVAAYSLMQDDYLSAWLDRPYLEVYLWGTVHDPRTLPPPPPQPLTWTVGNGGGAGTWGGGWGQGVGWGQGGGWGGGWDQRRQRRKHPHFYGFRRMGAIFRLPRPLDWQARLRERRRGWLIRLERRWRRVAALLFRLKTAHRELRHCLK
jgi:hypothetical protein